jgi:hypothetical protein
MEGVIAAALLRHVRSSDLMTRLRLLLMARRIDPETYCTEPAHSGLLWKIAGSALLY